jgi:hypothetical protein
MPLSLPRRSFLSGLASMLAAPAIVRATSLMPVRGIVLPDERGLTCALDLLQEAKAGLADWYMKRYSVAFFNQVGAGDLLEDTTPDRWMN